MKALRRAPYTYTVMYANYFSMKPGKKHAVSSYSLNVHYKIMWPAIYGFKIANSVLGNSSCMFECYEVETIHENASEATN